MSESLLEKDRLTTADIANPTPRQARAASINRGEVNAADNTAHPAIPLPASTAASSAAPAASGNANAPAQLFPDDELHNFRARWDQVQTSFVDEPRKAVEQADNLVASVVKRIAEQFAAERQKLEGRWDKGDDVNTEDLRQALRSYRSFFDRLLSF
jgi:predicted lipid-binding transport protein (Tim44 family)